MTSFESHRSTRLLSLTAVLLSCILHAGCSQDAEEPNNSSSGAPPTGAGSTDCAGAGSAGAPPGGAGIGLGSAPATMTAGAAPGDSAGNGGSAGMGAPATGGASGGLPGAGGDGGKGGAPNGGAGGLAGFGGVSGTGSALNGGASGREPTTVWIAGDSTVMTYEPGNTQGNNGATLEGWGQELGRFLNNKITINNQAIGGRSVAMFMWVVETDDTGAQKCADNQGTPQFRLIGGKKVDAPQWAKIKAGIKPGDFLLIQFGHNDETHTCPRYVSVTDYATYLEFMAETVIAKGATPIFVTPMGHRTFTGTKFNNTLLPYAQSMKGAAAAKSLEVLDLNLRSGEYYEKVGNSFLVTNIFDGGTTHFIKAGAIQMASLIAGELRGHSAGRLTGYLK